MPSEPNSIAMLLARSQFQIGSAVTLSVVAIVVIFFLRKISIESGIDSTVTTGISNIAPIETRIARRIQGLTLLLSIIIAVASIANDVRTIAPIFSASAISSNIMKRKGFFAVSISSFRE